MKQLLSILVVSFGLYSSHAWALGGSPLKEAPPTLTPSVTPSPTPERSMVGYCTSCHEMNFPYSEYLKSPHANKAACYDCHKAAGVQGMLTNAQKGYDHFITGNHNTEEKWNEGRLELARGVWRQLQEEKFMSCRQCHNSQTFGPYMKELAQSSGGTAKLNCVECHKGVAHTAPNEP